MVAPARLPRIEPMLLEPGSLPSDDQNWAYEVKYDGWRALAYLDRGTLRIDTRNGHDLTGRLPELAPLAHELRRHRLILDGELVAFDERGRPDFGRLQERMFGARGTEIAFIVFDLLHHGGESVMRLPFEERRRRLVELKINGGAWRTATHAVGNGPALLAASREMGLEGLIAKRLGSRYQPGKRSRDWVKIKNWDEGRFVVGGWVPGDDGAIDAVLVGTPDGATLRFAGRVELGVSRRLIEVLASIERPTSPFDDAGRGRARWVEPRLVAEVRYLAGSDTLRHAQLRHIDTE